MAVHENGPCDKYRHYYWIEKQKCTLIQVLQSRQFNLKVCVCVHIGKTNEIRKMTECEQIPITTFFLFSLFISSFFFSKIYILFFLYPHKKKKAKQKKDAPFFFRIPIIKISLFTER